MGRRIVPGLFLQCGGLGCGNRWGIHRFGWRGLSRRGRLLVGLLYWLRAMMSRDGGMISLLLVVVSYLVRVIEWLPYYLVISGVRQ